MQNANFLIETFSTCMNMSSPHLMLSRAFLYLFPPNMIKKAGYSAVTQRYCRVAPVDTHGTGTQSHTALKAFSSLTSIIKEKVSYNFPRESDFLMAEWEKH